MNGYALAESQTFQTRAIFSPHTLWTSQLSSLETRAEIKALSAVCQHRAMLVAEGKGNKRAFRCPYHHWTYSLDGDLLKGPAMEATYNFSEAHGLPSFQVELWLGFIFINFDPKARHSVLGSRQSRRQ